MTLISNPYAAALDPLTDCQIETLADVYLEYLGAKDDGYFVEAGAFDGFHWSNTQMLAALGWRGLLLEPHPVYYEQCKSRYMGNDKFDVLSLDVEGGELAALSGLNLDKWRPRLAIIETHELFPDIRLSWKAGAVETFFLPRGYKKIHADTINTIYWSGE